MRTAHGDGQGEGDFNLPDYRGQFLRGVDTQSKSLDPEADQRERMKQGGFTGRQLGSVQRHGTAIKGKAGNQDWSLGVQKNGIHNHGI